MMAAITAAESGAEVTLFEKNEKLGKKLYISGKGRCNITNDCSTRDFISNVVRNPKFLLGAINKLTPQNVVEMCQSRGLPLKTERGNRVFPSSDKSSDVIKFFSSQLAKNSIKVRLNTDILKIVYHENAFSLTTISDITTFDRVIIATGGVSYSATGSTGDGYKFAKTFGHDIVELQPALCRILCEGTKSLEGLSLKNVTLSLADDSGKILASEFGEMLFTDDGVSGPTALSLSSRINRLSEGWDICIDLKPALDMEKLDARLIRDFSDNLNKDFINSLNALLPERLIKEVAGRSGIPFDKKVNQITAAERLNLAKVIKNLRFRYMGLDNIEYGIVTSGGVDVRQINPSTMESKLRKGLYFAGEVMDVDAYTGGFNIQIALSTGYVAGQNAAREE